MLFQIGHISHCVSSAPVRLITDQSERGAVASIILQFSQLIEFDDEDL